ncbi:MAG TPA: alpha-isopropylmalate synthase regulatory domain-containing protein [Gammaproteobacteria bacterium]|nr:alpha-isopropylmalate synthase regulatory domain-containing protein [Gammaproteobacteria bacterium]
MNTQTIKIFDTTLRDGQQCPGAGMAFEKNIEYARLAAKAGIDVLEAGFPSASQTDFMIVNTIASELIAENHNSPIIAGLCQLREQQIEITINALQPAISHQKARLHTYLPVDPNLMASSLGDYANQKDTILKDLYRFIRQAREAGLEVEFSPEGYSRMGENFNFVTEAIIAAVSAGATIINCPDTIGGACKLEGEKYFVEHMKQHAAIIKKQFPDKNITWSAHCHNDFGLALENTMNAIFFGPVTQIEGCINGVGERAGNVSLEQCIMYIKHFGDRGANAQSFTTNVNTEVLQELSDFVDLYMLPRQPHWPITGENAARHSSGGHTNAVIKNPLAYQPFDPRVIGKEISFLFGPLSGGNHAKTIIEKFGYICEEHEKAAIAQFIKNQYADRRKGITDTELLQAYLLYRQPIKATQFDYSKTGDNSTLSITGGFFSLPESFTISYQGHESPLAALHKAILEYFPGITIESYHSHSASKSIEALSQSKIVIRVGDELFTGIGEDNDIEISALKALINATNQAYIYEFFRIKEVQ